MMINIWDIVSYTAGLFCFAFLVVVGWAVLAGMIEGIINSIKQSRSDKDD
nr:MAG TPA: Fibroblast growth factor receptor 3 transmembrane domain [Caudoviricetes sp.]DAY26798.1 MAG TPA: Fibroblast growth factor receptor 3 transmembrane domain [Caudoviricetes sp.]